MKNQIIKSKIDFFDEFIVSIGTKEHNYIMINENHYKQALYADKIKPFLSKLEPYYHVSKKFYLFRELNTISCVSPNSYSASFINFFISLSFINFLFNLLTVLL